MDPKLTREQIEEIVEAAREKGERPDLREAKLIELDLSKVDLSGVNLSGANLHRANLSRANLKGADLSDATLFIANLGWANLSGANLSEAKLGWADLNGANFSGADLSGADLGGANLFDANLSGANLVRANLLMANLNDANLTGADLSEAKLIGAILINTNFTKANLSGCSVYGISAWELKLDGATQSDLDISRWNEPTITVDNLEIAQFIYLLLHNETIRNVIDSITSKAVVILGRFKPEQKVVLDMLRDLLRRRDYFPIVVELDKPTNQGLARVISILARMARFMILDLTEAESVPQELQHVIPALRSVPVQPLLASLDGKDTMLEYFGRYPWVLETFEYKTVDILLTSLEEKVISPAEMKAKELANQ